MKAWSWVTGTEKRARRTELIFWGVMFALAQYPLSLGWLAWIALARPLMLIAPLDARSSFNSAYLFSLSSNVIALYWIGHVTPPGSLAAIAILSIYPAAIFVIFSAIHRRHEWMAYLSFPLLWTGMEYFRGLSEFSFPWTDIAYSQVQYLNFVQITSLTGMGGVTFLVVIVNVLIARAMRPNLFGEQRMTLFAVATVLIAGSFAYGWIIVPIAQSDPEIRIGLLQGNFPLEVKWSPQQKDYVFKVYDSLADLAGAQGSRLVVWPETAAPTYMLLDRAYVRSKTTRARSHDVPNLIGTLHADVSGSERKYYNAAVQIEADGRMSEPYLKRRLVPFAEQVPYQEKIPFLKRSFLEKYLTFIKTYDVQWWSDFYPGDTTRLHKFDDIEYAPFICFEVAYPEFVRATLHQGAQFILTITNDTWFKKSPGPFQHKNIAIMRAIENRIWLARSANSGFTFIADPYGNVRNELDWYTRGYLVGELSRHYHPSTYYRHGPVLARICYIFTFLSGLYFLILRIGRRYGLWPNR